MAKKTNKADGAALVAPADPEQDDIFEQGDLFACELSNWPIKDDLASMEFPLFSLAKQKDTTTREFRRGNRSVRIIPSSVGAATVFDKDLLLYVASQIVEGIKRGLPVSRTVHVESRDFLVGTKRSDGGASFDRIIDMLRRLRGTTIETNIPTGKEKITQTDGFSMVDGYRVLSQKTIKGKKKNAKTGAAEEFEVERVMSFTVTLSEWLYNALLSFEVLTLSPRYFELTRSIDRRLYELARKHCGEQVMWKINIDLLAEKIGTARERFKVRDEIRAAIKADALPEYKIALDTRTDPDNVVFYTRDSARLVKELMASKLFDWFQSLERSDNVKAWDKPAPNRKKKAASSIADD